MNARERFNAIMTFDTSVRTLKWEFGYWAETMKRWYGEGLPMKAGIPQELKGGEEVFGEGIPWKKNGEPFAKDVHDFFELDRGFERVPVNFLFEPAFEYRVLEEDDERRVVVDEMGIRKQVRRDESSMPQFLEWPVRNRDDWEKMKEERLSSDIERRLPSNMEELADRYRERDFPLTIGGYPHGFFGTLRFLMGDEVLFTGYYDQPDLIHDVNATLCDLWIDVVNAVMDYGIELDCADMWEDMCYRQGPLISPAHFKEFMFPYYKRYTDFLKRRGVHNIWVDTDGNCSELIQLFIDCGVTGLSPMEVQSGMNVVKVRKEFPKLQMYGGIDKRMPLRGSKTIDYDLELQIPYMLKGGGYIPYLDHLVPPDVPWNGFNHYRKVLNSYILGEAS